MILSIEGPDGAGKSTLAMKIMANVDCDYFHTGKPNSHKQMKDLIYDLVEKHNDQRRLFIIDRYPLISELVYSRVFNRAPLLDEDDIKTLLSLKHKMIFCLLGKNDEYQVDTNLKSHKPEEFTSQVIKRHSSILSNYHKLFESEMIAEEFKITRYNYKKDNIKKIFDFMGVEQCADL